MVSTSNPVIILLWKNPGPKTVIACQPDPPGNNVQVFLVLNRNNILGVRRRPQGLQHLQAYCSVTSPEPRLYPFKENMGKMWVYIVVSIFTVLTSLTWAYTDSLDVLALQDLYRTLNYPQVLKGWEGADPCGELWTGIECSGSSVVNLKIQGLNLTGYLGGLLYNLLNLRKLDVSSNNLVGEIPDGLPPNVVHINMAFNHLSQNIPQSLMEMKRLQILNLSHNSLSGDIGNVFFGLDNLREMDLSYNYLTGDLPSSFASLRSLRRLNLSHNFLSGPICDMFEGLANIRQMDLSYNPLAGAFPKTTRVTRLGNAPGRFYLTEKQSILLILLIPVASTVLEVLFVLALRWRCSDLLNLVLNQLLSTNSNQQFTYESDSSIISTNPAELATPPPIHFLEQSLNPVESPIAPLPCLPEKPEQSPSTTSPGTSLSTNLVEPPTSPHTPSRNVIEPPPPSSTNPVEQQALSSQQPPTNPPEQPRKWDKNLKGFVVFMLAANIWLTSLAVAFQAKLQNGVGFALASYILTCLSALLLASSFGVLICLDGIRVLLELEPVFTVLNFIFVGAQVVLITLEIITGQGPAMTKIFFPVLTSTLDAVLKWYTYRQSTKKLTPP